MDKLVVISRRDVQLHSEVDFIACEQVRVPRRPVHEGKALRELKRASRNQCNAINTQLITAGTIRAAQPVTIRVENREHQLLTHSRAVLERATELLAGV
jgi:hypothetical protein